MKVEGVTFNENLIRSMSKKDFIAECLPVFFLDREEKDRKNMLSDIHDRITGNAPAIEAGQEEISV